MFYYSYLTQFGQAVRFEVKGKAGHLIRQATYLEMRPTPLRNFKATAQWLTESIFQEFVDLA